MDLPGEASEAAKYLLTTFAMPMQSARARRLQRRTDLRLHLGSGANRIPGWINIDLLRPGRRLDLYWDLRRGIPFRDASVRAIFAEHLLEHMSYGEGVSLLLECRRTLQTGGTLRLAVPDLGRYVASYLRQDDLIDRVRPGRRTRALALGEPFFMHGHRCMYDFETMTAALSDAGFNHVEQRPYGEGRLQPSPDSPERRHESMYVEAWIGASPSPSG